MDYDLTNYQGSGRTVRSGWGWRVAERVASLPRKLGFERIFGRMGALVWGLLGIVWRTSPCFRQIFKGGRFSRGYWASPKVFLLSLLGVMGFALGHWICASLWNGEPSRSAALQCWPRCPWRAPFTIPSADIDILWYPPPTFTMGRTVGEEDRNDDQSLRLNVHVYSGSFQWQLYHSH